jgi:hypothetical protein
MGGSFESGAGDDPNDLFEDSIADEESEDDEPAEIDSEEEGSSGSSERGETDIAVEPESEPEGGQSRIRDPEGIETSMNGTAKQNKLPEAHEIERAGTMDAAQLARAFVPDSYEKPHPWALGRNGVNDGRTAKKTFFLQSDVIALEAACLGEVNQQLDGEVPLTDLRELALILAYHDPERLAEAALEWGSESA